MKRAIVWSLVGFAGGVLVDNLAAGLLLTLFAAIISAIP